MKGVTANRTTEPPAETAELTGEEPAPLMGRIMDPESIAGKISAPTDVPGEPEAVEGEITAPPDESEEPPELLGDVAEIPESGETDE
jgi:hypothetical protein